MPVISATLTILRTPPRRRDCWTMVWIAAQIVSGMNEERMFRSVVLPEPVPPETRMLSLARTAERRKVMISGLDDRKRFTTSAGPHFSLANLRIVSAGPLSAMGGITTLTREPSL